MLESASEAAIASVFTCRQLATLELWGCDLAARTERLDDCVAMSTLNLAFCHSISALPGRLGDCAALATPNLTFCYSIALPERPGDCAALTTLDLSHCRGSASENIYPTITPSLSGFIVTQVSESMGLLGFVPRNI